MIELTLPFRATTRQAMETIIASYASCDTIHLVMDNLNIHGPKSLTDHFGKEKGLVVRR
jgi:hypothetical protein